jgi:hypothetical protein
MDFKIVRMRSQQNLPADVAVDIGWRAVFKNLKGAFHVNKEFKCAHLLGPEQFKISLCLVATMKIKTMCVIPPA